MKMFESITLCGSEIDNNNRSKEGANSDSIYFALNGKGQKVENTALSNVPHIARICMHHGPSTIDMKFK